MGVKRGDGGWEGDFLVGKQIFFDNFQYGLGRGRFFLQPLGEGFF